MTQHPLYVYFHICCINNWKEITLKIVLSIKESSIYEKITKVRCFLLGKVHDSDLEWLGGLSCKIEIAGNNQNTKLYEAFTLQQLWLDSQYNDFNVLYLHAKGVSWKGRRSSVNDWVDYLIYFNVDRGDNMLKLLDQYSVIGVNLQSLPELHFSGNFWWSKASYIKTLNNDMTQNYLAAEFWICSGTGHFRSLWNSNINHYKDRYSPEEYKDRDIKLIEISN